MQTASKRQPYRVLLNRGFCRKEVFVDELGTFLIFKRLGIQQCVASEIALRVSTGLVNAALCR
jgi:hypothetical protein